MLKINGEVKSVVFNTFGVNQKLFTGNIFITELDGSFLSSYRVNKGEIIAKSTKSNTSEKASKDVTLKNLHGMARTQGEGGDGLPDLYLDEVVITPSNLSNNYISIPYIFPDYSWQGGGYSWGYGGNAINLRIWLTFFHSC